MNYLTNKVIRFFKDINMIKKVACYFLVIGPISVFSQTLGIECKDEKYGIEKFSVIDLTNTAINFNNSSKVFPVEITNSEVKWKIKNDNRVSDSSYEGHTYFRLNRFNLTMEEFDVFVGGATLRSTYNCKLHQKKF